jgi:hypothetical protein
MRFPFERNVVLKDEGEKIVVESLQVPTWNFLVTYISTGLINP